MGALVPIANNKGLNPLTENDCTSLDLARLVLTRDQSYASNSGAYEIAAVVLSGSVTVRAAGQEFRQVGGRPNVFGGKPNAIFIPSGTDFTIETESNAELALCSAKASSRNGPAQITPSEMAEGIWGAANFASKYCLLLGLDPQPSPSQVLVVGETITPSGHWSTYPPHKHDVENPPFESWHEEIYYFQTAPADGFGLFRTYGPGQEERTYTIRNNTALSIPRGFHTMVSAPGTVIYALWFTVGHHRAVRITLDPALAWVANTVPMFRPEA